MSDTSTAKVLYLIGHPLNTILSLVNRETKLFVRPESIQMHQGNENAMRHIRALDHYLREGVNCFQFKDHYMGWAAYCAANEIPMKVVEYTTIPDKLDEIAEFLEIRIKYRIDWHARQSKWEDHQYREELLEVHGDDVEFFNSII